MSLRFQARVFVYLLVLSAITSVMSGATFYRRQVQYLQKDRVTRADTLLTGLATQAELGAYAQDASLCDLPVRRTFREPDVMFAAVYDTKGKEILQMVGAETATPPPPSAASLEALTRDPDAPPLRLSGDVYEDLWSPIVTSVRPAGLSALAEPGETAAKREVVGLARVGLSLLPARERLAEVFRTGLYLSIGLLLLGAMAAVLIAGRISGPILALARGADEIRNGNLEVQINVRSNDEIGMLAESFNRMTVELRDTMAKLATLNRNLETEVEHRTDEIRRGAEFTQILNAPIDGASDVADSERASATGEGDRPELERLLDSALQTLQVATHVQALAILLAREEAVEFELKVAAVYGTSLALGALPSYVTLQQGHPILDGDRGLVPILFRGEPIGAIILRDERLSQEAVDFAARAAGQLAIAISNVRAYAALQHLATELRERNQALVRQRDQLSEMNRLKSEFLANTSHELRTPLNAILGYAELIAEGIYGPTTTEQREGLEGIRESATNLLTLINQILDLSKIESGKVEVYVTEVAIHDLAQHVASEARVLAKARPYTVEVDCPSLIVIRTDHLKVQQIVTNLVANAIKFTEQGFVKIVIRQTADGGCTIEVADSGIGIKAEDQARIFSEFRQVDGSSTRRYGGTGLGLAIAKRFALLLGGQLTVESEPGKGSTFTLRLPAEVKSAARPPVPPISSQQMRQ